MIQGSLQYSTGSLYGPLSACCIVQMSEGEEVVTRSALQQEVGNVSCGVQIAVDKLSDKMNAEREQREADQDAMMRALRRELAEEREARQSLERKLVALEQKIPGVNSAEDDEDKDDDPFGAFDEPP